MTTIDKNMPICKCHNYPMRWKKNPRNSKGGDWTCTIKRREESLKWQKENKEKRAIILKRYFQSEKGRKNIYKVNNSTKGYLRKRKFQLKGQRENILSELQKLREENPWIMN